MLSVFYFHNHASHPQFICNNCQLLQNYCAGVVFVLFCSTAQEQSVSAFRILKHNTNQKT